MSEPQDWVDRLTQGSAEPAAVATQTAEAPPEPPDVDAELEDDEEEPRSRRKLLIFAIAFVGDLLFVLARILNRANLDGLGGDDVYWRSERLAAQQGEAGDDVPDGT